MSSDRSSPCSSLSPELTRRQAAAEADHAERARLRRRWFGLLRVWHWPEPVRRAFQQRVLGTPSIKGATARDLRTLIDQARRLRGSGPHGIIRFLLPLLPRGPQRLRAFCLQRFRLSTFDLSALQPRQIRGAIGFLKRAIALDEKTRRTAENAENAEEQPNA